MTIKPLRPPAREPLAESFQSISDGTFAAYWAVFLTWCASLPKWTGYAIVGAIVTIAVIIGVVSNARGGMGRFSKPFTAAFTGNVYLAVNDLPRLVQALSEDRMTQQSCLHTKASLSSILLTGNGMANAWQNDASLTSDGGYDLGACTVVQLLYGKDKGLVYSFFDDDARNFYKDDGRNPCFVIDDYFSYINETMTNASIAWDFVVLSDSALTMAINRNNSLSALRSEYSEMLSETGAVPIILDAHAFLSEDYGGDDDKYASISDVASFASKIYQGAREYALALSENLPSQQKARIAPVSLAFLTVFEEDPELYQMLFAGNVRHASTFGSFLIACVLYGTMTRHMPLKELGDDVESLYSKVRLIKGKQYGYPDPLEAEYLYDVARRVALNGYKPAIFIDMMA